MNRDAVFEYLTSYPEIEVLGDYLAEDVGANLLIAAIASSDKSDPSCIQVYFQHAPLGSLGKLAHKLFAFVSVGRSGRQSCRKRRRRPSCRRSSKRS